jgi:hypothetical protein
MKAWLLEMSDLLRIASENRYSSKVEGSRKDAKKRKTEGVE